MKIGYPCINLGIGCTSAGTFRLRSFSRQAFMEKVAANLDCLLQILLFNAAHQILFFRISSDIVPFASHPICRIDWRDCFREKLGGIGVFIRRQGIRVSMHPDQFTLINSLDDDVFSASLRELAYHARMLDSLGLDQSAKIQIHVGGVYGDRDKAIGRFISRYRSMDESIKRRLVIENDDRNYTASDCLKISDETGIPVVLDVFHHRLNNEGEPLEAVFPAFVKTWGKKDGLPIVDYSAQQRGARRGTHSRSLPVADFHRFLDKSKPYDFDLMLEIKDKERSALKALAAAGKDGRIVRGKT